MKTIDRLIEIENRAKMSPDGVVIPFDDYEWLTNQIRPTTYIKNTLSDEEISLMIDNNLSYGIVKDRLDNNWDRHKAVTYPPHYRNVPPEWYDKSVVSGETLRARVRKGWTYEEAALTEKHKKPERLKED